MRVLLTPDDLKKGDLVDPGWYPVEITDYNEKEANTDKSTNCFFHFRILDGPEKAKGVQPRKMFNEKAMGFGKNLWATLNLPYNPKTGYELTTELFRKTIGFKLQIFIQRGKSDKGNEFNDVVDFRPMS